MSEDLPENSAVASWAADVLETSNMRSTVDYGPWAKLAAIAKERGTSLNKIALGAKLNRGFFSDGKRGRSKSLNYANLTAISRHLGIPIHEFYEGPFEKNVIGESHEKVTIVGLISTQGLITPMPDGSVYPVEVAGPYQTQLGLRALLVVDDTFIPYRPGDILFISETVTGAPVEDPAGAVCAVETADGRRLVRCVTAQPNGLYTLSGFMGLPEIDVALIRVSRMILHQPKAFQLHP